MYVKRLHLSVSVPSRFIRATIWTVAHQATLSTGFSRQEYWSGLPFPSPGDLPDTGKIKLPLLGLLHGQAGSLPLSPPGSPKYMHKYC